MKRLNELLQELGISKVRLAKYLGVSRQMVYNYLELDDINKWPKEKKILLYKLLDITDDSEHAIEKITVKICWIIKTLNNFNFVWNISIIKNKDISSNSFLICFCFLNKNCQFFI